VINRERVTVGGEWEVSEEEAAREFCVRFLRFSRRDKIEEKKWKKINREMC
jgi:hypothetical protein